MSNITYSETPRNKKKSDWNPDEVAEQVTEKRNRFFEWWFNLTAIPDAPANASFIKREASRKARLLSTVMFYYTLVIIVFLPCCLLLPNKYDFWLDAGLIVLSFVALTLNRQGRTFTAGVLIVAGFQATLTIIIFTTIPFDEPSIQIYDLYLMTILLAVSLLPARSVFIVAVVNSACIMASVLWGHHMPALDTDLHQQFIVMTVRPLALQFIIAGVAYVWVYSTSKAIARADRAEMVAALEHALVEQKRELEEGIEQILQTHVAIANGNLNARAPLTQENMLWQIARALNTLLVRFQRASIAEKELQHVEEAIHHSVGILQQAEQRRQLPRLPFTHTPIDPLIAALQGKNLAYTRSPFSSGPLPKSETGPNGQPRKTEIRRS